VCSEAFGVSLWEHVYQMLSKRVNILGDPVHSSLTRSHGSVKAAREDVRVSRVPRCVPCFSYQNRTVGRVWPIG
jgi:hypothetical protein